MNKRVKGLVVALALWFFAFLFVIAGFSGGLGFEKVTGFAVSEGGSFGMEAQSIAILLLLFTNLTTIFFLTRSVMNK